MYSLVVSRAKWFYVCSVWTWLGSTWHSALPTLLVITLKAPGAIVPYPEPGCCRIRPVYPIWIFWDCRRWARGPNVKIQSTPASESAMDLQHFSWAQPSVKHSWGREGERYLISLSQVLFSLAVMPRPEGYGVATATYIRRAKIRSHIYVKHQYK